MAQRMVQVTAPKEQEPTRQPDCPLLGRKGSHQDRGLLPILIPDGGFNLIEGNRRS